MIEGEKHGRSMLEAGYNSVARHERILAAHVEESLVYRTPI
ncbi:hypothetical protein CAter282_4207 [Collimonas arenae]|uniref:Uncharacterized protein n=1 Tax=Collimonas arenae TaxID=279058 RepID=A0A127QPH7_9BURK|nr:hypothetical protein CAter10_4580 [Collimonas arenae]AMP11867.1 hypothetical protein CAter282_4207 [Collimonas arenae]